MEWTVSSNAGIPCLPLIPLGVFHEDKYHISNECLSKEAGPSFDPRSLEDNRKTWQNENILELIFTVYLDEIESKLSCEDSNTRSLRRALGFMDIIKKDLIHILIEAKDQPSIFRLTIKLLFSLTLPVECLVSSETFNQESNSQVILYELTQLLYHAKEALLDHRASQAILDNLRRLLKQQSLPSEDNELINDSLLLIRNILHAPERPSNESSSQEMVKDSDKSGFDEIESVQYTTNQHSHTTNCSQQNRLLHNLLVQGLGRLLIDLLNNSQKEKWVVTIVQLIPLLYKDYRVEKIQTLFGIRIPETESKLFGEGENETQLLSNDNELNNLKNVASDLNVSDVSATEHTGFEFERNMKNASTEDILELLKEFTFSFLLNGYNTLIGQLHQQQLQDNTIHLDKSYFFWLITYFLRFVSQLDELYMNNFKNILNIDLFSYIAREARRETDEFKTNVFNSKFRLKPCLRRLHLCVTAITEYLQAFETYSLQGVSKDNKKTEKKYRGYLPIIMDLRKLFLIQLQIFNPTFQSRRYLLDVIKANHILLLTQERIIQQTGEEANFDLRQHLKQFCSNTIVSRYGTALEDFKTNGSFVNNCILTMLHHIGVDLGRIDLLYDPVILGPFNIMHEEKLDMCDDWFDLIHYVLRSSPSKFHTTEANSWKLQQFGSI